MHQYVKKIFKHGGSKAIDLPIEALSKKNAGDEVVVEVRENGVFIYLDELTNMESDPQFSLFIEALLQNALENPGELKSLKEVWDEEWDELLDGVVNGDEEEISA